MESHLKNVHKTKLKKEDRSAKTEARGKKAPPKTQRASAVAFPWRWVGVGVVVLIIILSVVILRPSLPGGTPPPPQLPEECIDGKVLQVNFVVTLHILVTDVSKGMENETRLIPNGIGTSPINDQACTRRLHTEYDYDTESEPARIQVKSPEPGDFTLGDFFEIWDNQTLAPGRVVNYWTEFGWKIIFKVNGATLATELPYVTPTYHYEDFILHPDQQIEFYVSK